MESDRADPMIKILKDAVRWADNASEEELNEILDDVLDKPESEFYIGSPTKK